MEPKETLPERKNSHHPLFAFMNMRFLRLIILLIIAALGGYYVGVNKVDVAWKNYNPEIHVKSKEPPPGVSTIDFSQFWNVMQKVQAYYYDKSAINAQKLLNGAITGMVGSLEDPYTVYLPPQQNKDFKQGLAGKFEGIGAELGMRGKEIIVVAPIDGGPAQKSGIRAGDAIVKVDSQLTFGWTLNQAVDKIRGPKGSKVLLTILHKDEKATKDISITRDEIKVSSITSWVKPIKEIDEVNQTSALKNAQNDKVAYIRISQFGDTTNDEWMKAINELKLKMNPDESVKGFVLDLRNNPGGYLTHAQFIASEFLPTGRVVVYQDDGRGNKVSLTVERSGLYRDIPLVVLINKGSASASEIVAGALRDHNRATLVGETSFGKGTIQTAEDLGGGAGIHVTVAKWLTPDETWVHNKGLTPDVQVELDKKDPSHDTQLEKAIESLLQ